MAKTQKHSNKGFKRVAIFLAVLFIAITVAVGAARMMRGATGNSEYNKQPSVSELNDALDSAKAEPEAQSTRVSFVTTCMDGKEEDRSFCECVYDTGTTDYGTSEFLAMEQRYVKGEAVTEINTVAQKCGL